MTKTTKLSIHILIFLTIGLPSATNAQAVSSVPQYDLTIRVLPDAHRLEAAGTVRLPSAPVSRSTIRLSLSGLMRDFNVEVLEPVASAGPAGVERGDANGKNIKWTVRPIHAIPGGRAIKLRFSYSGGEKLGDQFYIGPEVSFASAWGTDWYPLIDGENDKGIGSLRLSVPTGQTAYATGSLTSWTQEAEQGVFRFDAAQPTYFAFAAGNYTVVRHDGAVPMSAYLLHPRQNFEQYLDGVSRILDVLTQEFGKYPFDGFALVEIPRDLAQKAGFNAAGVQGFILVNSRALDAPDAKYVLNFFGHEFSHQWFPNDVALKTPPGLYMEEALAEYGGLRVVETLAGPEAAERYRRTGFEYDPGYSALQYFKLVGAGVDHPLSDLQPKLEHRNLAYSKGFLVLDMLSREIGREKFQRILHDLTRRYAFKEVGWTEFLSAVESGAGRNLGWFYQQWFDRTGAPDFQLTWRQRGQTLRGVITQTSPYYQATLEVEAKNDQGQRLTRAVKVHGAQTTFSFRTKFRVDTVTLDPHYLVLRWTSEYRDAATAVHPPKQE
jgi:Peptidase family M1 domain